MLELKSFLYNDDSICYINQYIYVNINQIQNNVYPRGIEEIHITRVLLAE